MEKEGPLQMRSLIILVSYHNMNTRRIAEVFARVLDAQLKAPTEISPEETEGYGLLGFGSGIYDAKHHDALLDLAGRLPRSFGKRAFIFSTFGVPGSLVDDARLEKLIGQNHARLRESLQSKGYVIVGEFSCPGHNTNSFLKLFGGINKGRPDAGDIGRAETFARRMKRES
jgi:flavodoxin